VGDLVIFTAAFYAAGLTVTHSGGTLDGFNFSSNTAGLTTAIGWRTFQSGDTAPVFSCGATAEQFTAFMLAYTPAAGKYVTVDTTACNNTTAAGRTYTPPAASAVGSGEISVIINLAFGQTAGLSAISQTLPTTPGSYTAYVGSSAYTGASVRHASFAGGGSLTGQGPGSIAPGSESVNPASVNNTQCNVYQVLLKETSWSVLQSAGNTSAGATLSAVYPSNLSSGTKLIAAVGIATNNTGAVTVSDGTNSFTQLVHTGPTSTDLSNFYLFALDTPAGDVGTKPTITVTGAASNGAAVTILEVAGLLAGNTTACLDGTAGAFSGVKSGGGTSSPTVPAYVSTVANEFLVNIEFDDGDSGSTWTAPAGYTTVTGTPNGNSDANIGFAYKNSTGGTETGTFSVTSSGGEAWGVILVAFKLTGGGGGTESGTFAITLPAPTTSLSGTAQQTESGAFNITLSVPTTSLSGTAQHTESGAFNITLPTLTASLSAKLIHEHGTFNIALPVPTTALTGSAQHTESGSFNLTLPVPTVSLAAKLIHEHGTFNTTLPTLISSLSGTAQHTESGSFNIVLPVPTVSLVGSKTGGESGSFNIVLLIPASSLSAKVVEHGSFNITLPTLTSSLSGTAQHTETGSFNITLPTLTSSLTGKVIEHGPFNITLPMLTSSLVGHPQHTESGPLGPSNTIVLPTLTTSLSGAILSTTISGPFVIWLPPGVRLQEAGTFNVTLPQLTTNLSGTVQFTESGPFNIVLPAPRLVLTARYNAERGPFNLVLPKPSTLIAGLAQQTITGSLVIVLPALSGQINAARVHDGTLLIWLGFGGMGLEGRFRDHALNFKFPPQESIRIPEPVLALQGTVQRPRLGPGDAHVSGYLEARKTRQGRRRQLKEARQRAGTIHKTGLEGADETYGDA
jgi:hypothetical protein